MTPPKSALRARVVSFLEGAAQWSLLGVTALLPWSFGGVDPFSQSLMFYFLLAAQGCCLLSQVFRPTTPAPVLGVAAPAVVLLLLGLVQTVPVSDAALESLSPRALELRRQLLPAEDAPTTVSSSFLAAVPPSALSVYAPATRKEVALLFCGLAVLLMAATLFQSTKQVLLVAGALVVNGALVAYFGILQQMSWNGLLYWTVPIEGSTPFGPFVNRNAAGGYLALCLAGALPVIAWVVSPRGGDLGTVGMGLRTGRRPEGAVLAVVILLGLLLGGLCATMSRGAWLGAVVGAAAALAIIGRARLQRGLLLTVFGGLAVAGGLLGWLSLTAPIGDRLASIANAPQALQSRWELWQDTVRMVPDFWRIGSGLGTFGLVQPQYQTQPMLDWFDQAENLYLQALIEAGVVGSLMLVAVVIIALRSIRPLLAAGLKGAAPLFAAMGAFAVCSQAVCAGFDFSLRYPANQLALALTVGAVIGYVRSGDSTSPSMAAWKRRVAAIAVHALLLAGLMIALSELAWAGGIDLLLNRGQTEFDESKMTVAEIDDELANLQLFLKRRPDDAEGHLRCAALSVVRYRQQALEQMRRELEGALDDNELWQFTSPMVLHARAAEFALTGDDEALADLRADPVVRENLEPALQHALLARSYGPLLCRAHQLLGQLCFLYDEPQQDAPHIERAAHLLPQDPAVRYWAGALHFQSGRMEPARKHWRRCLALSLEYDDRIIPVAMEQMPLEEFVNDLLPDAPEVLLRVADRRMSAERPPEWDRLLGAKLMRLLDASSEQVMESADSDYWRARALQLVGDLEPALESLKRAAARNPGNVEWRMRLAALLRDLGHTREAVREAEVCVRLDPENAAAQQLLDEISAAELDRARAAQDPHVEPPMPEPRAE